jgi:RimJ/RimL family protein N-acetyltransferase
MGPVAHPYWPLFDLEVRTPRLTLRAVTDELAVELAALAARGIHDPSTMPFAVPWTDVPSPELERNTLQFYWRLRSELGPASWNLALAAIVDGVVVGTTGPFAHDFGVTRTFETGSWLGREFQGQGLGTEMRLASLHLGFVGFGARAATTAVFADNPASLAVTLKLGYSPNGVETRSRRGEPAECLRFWMPHEHFHRTLVRDDVELIGVERVKELLAIP